MLGCGDLERVIVGIGGGRLIGRDASELRIGKLQLNPLDRWAGKSAVRVAYGSTVDSGKGIRDVVFQIVNLGRAVALDLRPKYIVIVAAGEVEVGSLLSDVASTKNDIPWHLALEAKRPGLLVRGSRRGTGAEGANGSVAHVIHEA